MAGPHELIIDVEPLIGSTEPFCWRENEQHMFRTEYAAAVASEDQEGIRDAYAALLEVQERKRSSQTECAQPFLDVIQNDIQPGISAVIDYKKLVGGDTLTARLFKGHATAVAAEKARRLASAVSGLGYLDGDNTKLVMLDARVDGGVVEQTFYHNSFATLGIQHKPRVESQLYANNGFMRMEQVLSTRKTTAKAFSDYATAIAARVEWVVAAPHFTLEDLVQEGAFMDANVLNKMQHDVKDVAAHRAAALSLGSLLNPEDPAFIDSFRRR